MKIAVELNEDEIATICNSLVSYRCELENYDFKTDMDKEVIKKIKELLIKLNK